MNDEETDEDADDETDDSDAEALEQIEKEGLWSEGAYIRSVNPNDPDFQERMKYFHEEENEPKEHQCKKCKATIGKHNLYWHESMCNECFFDTYDL